MGKRIEVGKIVNTFGIKGEIKIYPYVSYFDEINEFYVGNELMKINKKRFQKNIFIVSIKGINDINLIEKYKGETIEIDENNKPKPEDGEYYIEDLIGMEVYTDDGKLLGKLDDIFNTGANDIYQVGDILLPATDEVLKQIDTENNKIIVHIIKGLL